MQVQIAYYSKAEAFYDVALANEAASASAACISSCAGQGVQAIRKL